MASLTMYPCKDCPDRSPGCHSRCEKYIKAKNIETEIKKKKRDEWEQRNAIKALHKHRRTKKSSNHVISTKRKG